MSKNYPLVGYVFCIIQGRVVAVTGEVVQGHGPEAYLVRFNTGAPYNRILRIADPLWDQLNIFPDTEEMENFCSNFYIEQARQDAHNKAVAEQQQAELSASNDVEAPEESNVVGINAAGEEITLTELAEEDTDNPAVA